MGQSSWFGFSFIVKGLNPRREKIIEVLTKSKIDCRPIVTGDFTKNEVMRFFNYKKHNNLPNADQLHNKGFFVGNSQESLKSELNYLKGVISGL
jgi:CDP-6-deoxy-D-xylo-4-hexulose-3-dehydrase